jgi:hypothetical protein
VDNLNLPNFLEFQLTHDCRSAQSCFGMLWAGSLSFTLRTKKLHQTGPRIVAAFATPLIKIRLIPFRQVLGWKLLADMVKVLIGVHHQEAEPQAPEDFMRYMGLPVGLPRGISPTPCPTRGSWMCACARPRRRPHSRHARRGWTTWRRPLGTGEIAAGNSEGHGIWVLCCQCATVNRSIEKRAI